MNYIMKLKISVVKMEHKRLYEIKIEQLEKENQELKLKLEKQDLIKEGYKEEISKWNKKYKDLKKQITNG
jgi:predicted RNase H-like nuclease (RuvC/YqgF family)